MGNMVRNQFILIVAIVGPLLNLGAINETYAGSRNEDVCMCMYVCYKRNV